jgi:hypothetical protein
MIRAVTALVALVAAAPAVPAQVAPADDAADVIIKALEKHDIVGLSEEHRGVQFHGFLHSLIADPRLPGRVQDLVVEFGNPRYQSIPPGGEAAGRQGSSHISSAPGSQRW